MEPVILIHGALGSASQMAPLNALLSASRDVHVLELEGHGDLPDTPHSFEQIRFPLVGAMLQDFVDSSSRAAR